MGSASCYHFSGFAQKKGVWNSSNPTNAGVLSAWFQTPFFWASKLMSKAGAVDVQL
jgi:hypothetical protein